MSAFVLPRNERNLRFTGEVKALGKARTHVAPPPKPRRGAAPINQALIPTLPAPPPPNAIRDAMPSFDDELPTLAFNADEVLLPLQRPPTPDKVPSAPPVFQRQPQPDTSRRPRPQPQTEKRASGFPLLIWLALAILAGTASYRYSPDVVDHIRAATAHVEN
jgi:hypothetical protein